MVLVPIITPLAKIISIFFPFKLIIPLLSKTFPMSHGHFFKISITHIRIISHKLIHTSVNSPNNLPNIKFSLLKSNLNPTMILTYCLFNLSNLFLNLLVIWSISWIIMRNWVTISLSPLYGVMLLLASDIFESEN